MKSDTRIHNTELLLTLDYLLNHTDERHPATQLAICRHARNYGLKYNEKSFQGNDVKRQRITEYLHFLEEVCEKFPDKVPFVLQKTDSGKYYIEQRNGLDEDQIAKVLALIMDDKYIKGVEGELLIERLLGAFASSEDKRKEILYKAELRSRGGLKADKETIRRIELIEKAYREGKLIYIDHPPRSSRRVPIKPGYYRVYLIKNINDEPWAFLLPVKKEERPTTLRNYIFRAISTIPVGKAIGVLMEDFDPHRDFDELFRQSNPVLSKRYDSLDDMLEQTLCPKGGKVILASFYFELRYAKEVTSSFETFFSEKLFYQECSEGDVRAIADFGKELGDDFDNWRIVVTDTPKTPYYGLATISVDGDAFLSWLLSGGSSPVFDRIEIIKPRSLNEDIVRFYAKKTQKAIGQLYYLPKSKREALKNSLLGVKEKD